MESQINIQGVNSLENMISSLYRKFLTLIMHLLWFLFFIVFVKFGDSPKPIH